MVRLTPFDEWFPANVRGLTADCYDPTRDIWVLLELDSGPMARTFPIGTREGMLAEITDWLLGSTSAATDPEATVEAWATLIAEQVVDDCLGPMGATRRPH